MTEQTKTSQDEQAKFGYSYDEEMYHGEFDSREAAIAEAKEGLTEPLRRVWTGRCVIADLSRGVFDSDDLIERSEDYNDVIGDIEPFAKASREQRRALEKSLTATFREWIEEVGIRYYTVDDVQEHVLIASDDDD